MCGNRGRYRVRWRRTGDRWWSSRVLCQSCLRLVAGSPWCHDVLVRDLDQPSRRVAALVATSQPVVVLACAVVALLTTLALLWPVWWGALRPVLSLVGW